MLPFCRSNFFTFEVSLGFCDLGNHWRHLRDSHIDDCLGLSPLGPDLIGRGYGLGLGVLKGLSIFYSFEGTLCSLVSESVESLWYQVVIGDTAQVPWKCEDGKMAFCS